MSALRPKLNAANKALAHLAESIPFLHKEREQEAGELIDTFTNEISTLVDSVYGKLKGSYWELVSSWLSTFAGRLDLLRAEWRRVKWENPPAKRKDEPEAEYLRHLLFLALGEQGKKAVTAFLKTAGKHITELAPPDANELVPKPELNAFLKEIGRLTRAEADGAIRAKKPKFLKQIAEFRRIPFTEIDGPFVRKLHDSAVKFAKNTAI